MPVVRLDALNVKRLPPGEHRDSMVRGFVLRVRPGGARTFAIFYWRGGKKRRYTLGPLDKLPLAEARAEAKKLLARVALGEDPQEARAEAARAGLTLGKLLDEMMAALTLRPSTRYLWQRGIEANLRPRLGDEIAATITRHRFRRELEALHKRAKSAARTSFAILRRAYSWGVQTDRLAASQLVLFVPPGGNVRPESDRVLSVDEIRRVLQALDGDGLGDQYTRVVRLLFLTLMRREAVLGMAMSEMHGLDGAEPTWVVPVERSKSGRPHAVPLSRQAVTIIRDSHALVEGADVLFPPFRGPRRHMKWNSEFIDRLRARLPAAMPHWTIHNIRHTCATTIREQLGKDHELVGMLLGHTKRDVTGIYDRAQRLPARRAALQEWADYLDRIVAGGA